MRPWEYKAPEQPAAPAVAAPPPTQQPPAPPPQNGPMTPQLLFAKWGALIQGVFPYLQDHFLNYGGADFQDWFVEHKGLDTWNAFKKDATPELLTQATQMHPQLKSIFTPEEKVLAFFASSDGIVIENLAGRFMKDVQASVFFGGGGKLVAVHVS